MRGRVNHDAFFEELSTETGRERLHGLLSSSRAGRRETLDLVDELRAQLAAALDQRDAALRKADDVVYGDAVARDGLEAEVDELKARMECLEGALRLAREALDIARATHGDACVAESRDTCEALTELRAALEAIAKVLP